MKNILKYLLALAVAGLMLSSCIKETFPTDVATPDQIEETPSGLESAVNALNGWLTKFNSLGYKVNEEEHFDFGYPALCLWYEALGQDMTGPYTGYDKFYFIRNVSSHSDEGFTGWFPWQYLYRQILLANSVISTVGLENLTTEQKYYVGQALVFRSMAYFDLARLYSYRGPETGAFTGLSVPVITEETSAEEAKNNPRVEEDKLYDERIIPDLKLAVDYLDGYTRPSKNYVNQAVAQGFLARVYLQREMWPEAEAAARDAYTNSRCKPLSEAEYLSTTSGFNEITTSAWMWGTVLSSEDDAVQTGICNFTSMVSVEVTGTYAWVGAYKMIDAALYASIPDSDFRKKLFKDPEGKIETPTLLPEAQFKTEADYLAVKFRPKGGNTDDTMAGVATDFPLMRVEEMYLIEAEAAAMQNAGRGKTLLENFVKTYRDASYTCDASSSAEVQDAVFQQRRIEFWGEGITPFDFKRLGKPIVRGYKGTSHGTGFRYNCKTGVAPWLTLCIPRTEMENNAGVTASVNNPNATLSRGTLWDASTDE